MKNTDDKNMSEDWRRLRDVIVLSGCTSTNKFAARIGLKRSEILYRVKRGQNGISGELAARIVEHYPIINIFWLRYGEGEMLRSLYPDDRESEYNLAETLLRTPQE